MSDRKHFSIEVECQENLTVEEIWPDGDAPENPTVEDVIEKVRESHSVLAFTAEKVIEAAERLDTKQRLSVGLTETMIREARAALSQPEHQGDEREQLRELAEDLESRAGQAFKQCRPDIPTTPAEGEAKGEGEGFATAANAIRELLDAMPSQAPAPVLSDGERERLVEIAYWNEQHGLAPSNATDLRNLAYREQGGTELQRWAKEQHRADTLEAERDRWKASAERNPAQAVEGLREALRKEKRSLRQAAYLADEEGGNGSYYEHVIHGVERAEAALDTLKDES